MKNKEIVALHNNLKALKGLKGVKFNYAIARNISKLSTEIECLEKSKEQTDLYKEFEKERVELAKSFAKKNEKGVEIIVEKNYIILDQEAFDKSFEELKEKHKEAVAEREAQLKEYIELLDKESTFIPFKIKVELIPEEITTEQMNAIYPLVEE